MSYGHTFIGIAGNVNQLSQARYLPFGGYRQAPTTNPSISDMGYTGHKHNDDVGLIYMNARFYVPSIGRFASADTIVPDPLNSQAFNRYSYVENRPINFNDPTEHFSEEAIWNYVWLECLSDRTCAHEMHSSWQSDTEWWNMIRTAEAGDVMFVGAQEGSFAKGAFYTFRGVGDRKLSGISRSDAHGNKQFLHLLS